jgi:AcrR family transcriptional regulator
VISSTERGLERTFDRILVADMENTENGPRFDRKLSEILTAAAQVFAEEGYDRASIRSVAERAGISIAGLYYYVRSKEELLFLIQHQVFDHLVARFQEESSGVEEPAERLRLLVRNHLEWFLAHMAELVVCSREIDRLKGELSDRLEAKRREYFRQALRVFTELAERHGGANVEPRTAALAMFGTINWIYTWYRPGSGLSAERMADDFVRLYLRGILPEEEPD